MNSILFQPFCLHDLTLPNQETRLEDFAAELTHAVYPFVLRRGLKDWWIKVELSLWRALAVTVQKWAGQEPPAAATQELESWREGLLVELTESAFYVALKNGIKGPLPELKLCLYRAFRLEIRRRSHVRK